MMWNKERKTLLKNGQVKWAEPRYRSARSAALHGKHRKSRTVLLGINKQCFLPTDALSRLLSWCFYDDCGACIHNSKFDQERWCMQSCYSWSRLSSAKLWTIFKFSFTCSGFPQPSFSISSFLSRSLSFLPSFHISYLPKSVIVDSLRNSDPIIFPRYLPRDHCSSLVRHSEGIGENVSVIIIQLL